MASSLKQEDDQLIQLDASSSQSSRLDMALPMQNWCENSDQTNSILVDEPAQPKKPLTKVRMFVFLHFLATI